VTVYFALEEDSGRIKIGYCESADPQCDRIDPNLTMNTSMVTVLATLPGAGPSTEKLLHRAFEASRYRRRDMSSTEFFLPTAELWALIGFVSRNGMLPCPPAGCAALTWVPR
jgi:hypothetical protein